MEKKNITLNDEFDCIEQIEDLIQAGLPDDWDKEMKGMFAAGVTSMLAESVGITNMLA